MAQQSLSIKSVFIGISSGNADLYSCLFHIFNSQTLKIYFFNRPVQHHPLCTEAAVHNIYFQIETVIHRSQYCLCAQTGISHKNKLCIRSISIYFIIALRSTCSIAYSNSRNMRSMNHFRIAAVRIRSIILIINNIGEFFIDIIRIFLKLPCGKIRRDPIYSLFCQSAASGFFHCKIFMADIEFRINDCYDHSGAVAVCPVISYRRQGSGGNVCTTL